MKNADVSIFPLHCFPFYTLSRCLQPLWLLPFSFRGDGDCARDGKRKIPPRNTDSRSGINEKVYTKNGLY